MQNNTNNSVIENIQHILEPILINKNLELVDLEFQKEGIGNVLRLFIDKTGGVTVEDCASISRELSTLMDINEILEEKYVLEVSSPGLRRPLKKIDDYKKYKGFLVLVKTNEPIESRKVFKGYLKDTNDEGIEIDISGSLHRISYNQIKKANLEIDF